MTEHSLTSSHPFVSVIIPVYNDAARLVLCLQALEEQTYPSHHYEVVVIDNGSTENIAEVCKKFGQVSYAHESKPGSYVSRNKGMAVAATEATVFAFTDADCIPQQDWLERGVTRLTAAANCGLVGGRVELFPKNAAKPTAVELHEMAFSFDQKKKIEKQRYSVTANLFTYRSIFDEVGLFNEEVKSGGDREWSNRVFAAGYELVYASDVVIAHPARSSLNDMIKRELRLTGGGYSRMMRTDASSANFLRTVVKNVGWPSKKIFRLAIRKDLELNNWQKAKVASVLVTQMPLRLFELVRLRLGGETRR